MLYGQSEYMIGDVAVSVIFAESDNSTDPESETWDLDRVNDCIAKITEALGWWEDQEPAANLSFHVNSYGTRTTGYEPVTRPHNQEGLWIAEIMDGLGYSSDNATYLAQVAALNQYEMDQQQTDWAFTIFVVDSLNDSDGSFSDGWFAYSWIGGPCTIMTYDNHDYGIENMDWVCAHETGHIFWATDEYDGLPQYSGYLNVLDDEDADCIMSYPLNWNLCPATRGQIGWRDTDSDGILDPVDTNPDTVFDPAPPDFTSSTVLTYSGQADEIPLPNSNPQPWASGQDISINTIVDVQYRVDDGEWQSATPGDGAFDQGAEGFTFTISLAPGSYTIEVRSQNSAGNWGTPTLQHAVVIDTVNPWLDISGVPDFVRTAPWLGGTSGDAAPGELDRVEIQIKDSTQNTYWDGSQWTATATWVTASGTYSWSYPLPSLADGSAYQIRAMAIDKAGNESAVDSTTFTFDTTPPTLIMDDIPDPVDSLPAVSGTAADAAPGQLDRVQIQIKNLDQSTYWDEANWASVPTWVNAAGTDSWSRALPALTNGSTYEIRSRAIDSAGNASLEVSDTFTFDDLTTPTVSIIDLPDFVSSLSWISGTAADALPGQLDRVEIQIKNATQNAWWDGSAWIPDSTWVTAAGTYSWSYPLPPLDDGSAYEVSAVSFDSAANESTVDSEIFTFDSTLPTIVMNDVADPVNLPPIITGTAGDAPPGQLDRIEVQIRNVSLNTFWDGSSWVTSSAWITASGTSAWTCALTFLDDATYEVSARAVDRAGNTSTVASDGFTFDATIPSITVNEVPDLVNSLSSIGGTAGDAPPGQLDRVEAQIRNVSQNTCWDGSSWVTATAWIAASGTDSWNCLLPPLENGSVYQVKATAIDRAGNASAMASETFTFDTTIPTITVDNVPELVNSLSSIGGTAGDAPPGQLDRVEIRIRNASHNTCWDGSSWMTDISWVTASGTDTWSYAMPSLEDGSTYEIGAKAVDGAGNESAVARGIFTFDTTIPAVSMDDIPDSVNALSAIGGTASDAPPGQLGKVEIQIRNLALSTFWDGSSWVTNSAWVTASGTDPWSYAMPSLKGGSTYEITAKAVDRAENESAVAFDTFAVNTRMPLWIWAIIGVTAALLAGVVVLVLVPRLTSSRRARTG